MRLTHKQKKALEIVIWFIPSNVSDWNSQICRYTGYTPMGFAVNEESVPIGANPEEAFFMKTERGKKVPCKDIPKLISLLWGQRYMALTISLWKEGFEEGYFNPEDFEKEPIYIQKIAKECCLAVGRKWEI